MTKSNKRIQKKQRSKNTIKALIERGFTDKETRSLSLEQRKTVLRSIERKERKNNLRNAKRVFLKNNGIDNHIISHYELYDKSWNYIQNPVNISQWKKETANFRRQKTLETKKRRNFEKLRNAGFKKSEIKPAWLTRNDDFIDKLIENEFVNKVRYAKQWLLIMYSSGSFGVDLLYTTSAFARYTFQDLLDNIENRIEECLEDVDDSGNLSGFFHIFAGTLTACKEEEYEYSKHGYSPKQGKFVRDSYHTICLRNDFTQREFSEMLLYVISNTDNTNALSYVDDFKMYIEKNKLPFKMLYEIL